jgi:Bestrophin, RFP-TM, chloride channel
MRTHSSNCSVSIQSSVCWCTLFALPSSFDSIVLHFARIDPCITAGSPLNYARHSLRSLTIWLFSLPFALVSEFGVLTAPVMGVISWLLFGVYQIGSTIEDPFQGSLRLSILCDAIFRDVMYDADMNNQRDSAFQLEAELYEWNNGIGTIRAAAGQQVLAPPIISGPAMLNMTASPGANAVEGISSDTEPRSQSTTPTSLASTTDDPMQPRP